MTCPDIVEHLQYADNGYATTIPTTQKDNMKLLIDAEYNANKDHTDEAA